MKVGKAAAFLLVGVLEPAGHAGAEVGGGQEQNGPLARMGLALGQQERQAPPRGQLGEGLVHGVGRHGRFAVEKGAIDLCGVGRH